MTCQLRSLPLVAILILCGGCSSYSQFGMVLQPGSMASLKALGDNPFVRVDNDGPGPIEVSFMPNVGSTEQVRVLRGSACRSLRGGGTLQFVLVEGNRADVQIEVQNATGADFRTGGN